MTSVTPGIYEHANGNHYQVVGIALQTEDDAPVVVYRALYDCPDLEADYGMRPLFVRPLEVFGEVITREGVTRPRFIRVAEG